MYDKMREYFDNTYKSNLLINAVKKSDLSPCIVLISDIPDIDKEIIDNPKEINKLLNNVNKNFIIRIINIFGNDNKNKENDMAPNHGVPWIRSGRIQPNSKSSLYANEIHCIGGPILFRDKHLSVKINSLSKMPSVKGISSLLDKYRYINYEAPMGMSKKKSIYDNLQDIVYRLYSNSYHYDLCLYYDLDSRRTSILLDTISISFYRLYDVIPIYTPHKVNGLVMEFLMVNSTFNWNDTKNLDYCITARIIFSKYKDNLFIIDGESLDYGNPHPINDVLKSIKNKMDMYVPDDSHIKNYKENIVCAE